MHRVSDHLRDRYPYREPTFQDAYDPKDVTRAFGHRSIPKYAELLTMEGLSDDDRIKALSELGELLSNQELKHAANSYDIVFSCSDLCALSKSDQVQIQAANVLATIASMQLELDELGADATLRAIHDLLKNPSDQVLQATCQLVCSFCLSNDSIMLLLARDQVLHAICDKITDHAQLVELSSTTLCLVLEILVKLTRVRDGAMACIQKGIMPQILVVLKKYAVADAATLLAASCIVWNTATHDAAHESMINMNCVEILLKLLARVLADAIPCTSVNQQTELLRGLTGSLMAISSSESAKPRILDHGVDQLVACLHHSEPGVKQNTIHTINSACESPRGIFLFTEKLLPEKALLIEVLTGKVIPALNHYLVESCDEPKRIQALEAILTLCETADGTMRIVQCLGMLDQLAANANESLYPQQVTSIAQQILLVMSAKSPTTASRVEQAVARQQTDISRTRK